MMELNPHFEEAKKKFQRMYMMRMISGYLTSFLMVFAMIAIGVLILLRFVATPFTVRGDGMDTLAPAGSKVIANRVAYLTREPERGDVIVSDGKISRIVAYAGESVVLYGGHVYVNGSMLLEDYLAIDEHTYPIGEKSSFVVPKESYFVLCDNRACYDDSRNGSFVSREALLGKIIAVF